MSILEHKSTTAGKDDRASSTWLPNGRNAKVRTYRGKSLEALLPKIKAELGDNAVILREREGLMGGVGGFFATRFVEVQARAGGPSIDVYDGDDEVEFDDTPALPAAPAPRALPAAPTAPSAPSAPAARAAAAAASPTPTPAARAAARTARAAAASAAPATPAAPSAPAQPAQPAAPAAHAFPSVPAAPAPSAPAAPAEPEFPAEFSAKLQEAVAAWAAAEEPVAPVAEPVVPVQEPIAPVLEEPVDLAPAPVAEPEDEAPALAPIDMLLADEDDEFDEYGAAYEPQSASVTELPELPELTEFPEPAAAAAAPDLTETFKTPTRKAAKVIAASKPSARSRGKLPRKPAAPQPIDGDAAGRVYGDLVELGVSEAFARQLIANAGAHGAAVAGGLRAAVRQELTRRLAQVPSLPAHGGAIAFVGTGGSGKTVATAALAATYRYGSTLPVSVYSLCENLAQRSLAEMLAPDEVPVTRIPADAGRPAVTAARQLEAERQQGLVVLDTPAVTPGDSAGVNELSERLDSLRPDAVYVVLSAALGATAARRAVAGLAALEPAGLVISHADETDQIGVLIELAASYGLPVAYVTAGADHRRSLISSDPAALAQLLLP